MAYSTSQTVKDLFASETPQVFRGTFTFADSTTLVVDQSKVIMGSMVLDRSCVSGNSLELGSCVASEFSMTLLNDGSLDGYNFEGAELYAEIGVSDGTNTYYIPLGRFIVDGVPKVRDTVSINALDRMCKFDVEATGLATWWGSGEKTIQDIITKCRTTCGVTLATNISSFPNVSYGAKIPEEWIGGTAITYRQLLSYAVGCMGKIAWINAEGNLEIGFAEKLDLETSAIAGIAVVGVAIVGDSSGYGVLQSYLDESNRYSSEYEDYTVTITGVYCNITNGDDETQYITGTDDYAFDLSDNPLVAYNPNTAIASLSGLVGLSYTPITAVTVPYPYLFPMDWVSYKKGDTNLYSIVTNFTFTMNGNNGIKSVGENPTEKSRASVGSVSKAVKKLVEYTNEVAVNTLATAGENATAMITSATGGQMYFKKENGKIVEITMMDDACYADFISSNPQYNVGTCWRWNKNGFGYSSTGYNGTYGLAMTANGEIVADYITTGTMTADRIRGGELKLGGYNNQYGILKLYNASDGLELALNKDNLGIYNDGTFVGAFGVFTDENNNTFTRISSSYGIGGLVLSAQETSGGVYYPHYYFNSDSSEGFKAYSGIHKRYARINQYNNHGQLRLYNSSETTIAYYGASNDGHGWAALYDSSGTRNITLEGQTGNIYVKDESGNSVQLQPIMKKQVSDASYNSYANYDTGLSAATYTVVSARASNNSAAEGSVLVPFVAYGNWWVKAMSWYDMSGKTGTIYTTIYYVKQV